MNTTSAFLFSFVFAGAVSVSAAMDIHVSPRGDDGDAGTAAAPLRTLSAAQQAVRAAKAGGMPAGGITVLLHGGVYRLQAPLVLGPEDSGAAGRPVTWKAAGGEKAVVSGGLPVTGWQEHGNGIWKAKLNRAEKLRQFFVNDVPATMAANKRVLVPSGWYGKFVVTGEEPWAVGPGGAHEGIKFPRGYFPHIARPQDLETAAAEKLDDPSPERPRHRRVGRRDAGGPGAALWRHRRAPGLGLRPQRRSVQGMLPLQRLGVSQSAGRVLLRPRRGDAVLYAASRRRHAHGPRGSPRRGAIAGSAGQKPARTTPTTSASRG